MTVKKGEQICLKNRGNISVIRRDSFTDLLVKVRALSSSLEIHDSLSLGLLYQ